jgi:FkbM family methyltransferase
MYLCNDSGRESLNPRVDVKGTLVQYDTFGIPLGKHSNSSRSTSGDFTLKQLLKKLIGLTPYRVNRACDANRFQAIPECLSVMRQRGYEPRVVLDGGANIGDFARLVRRVFGPEPMIHMFEPQPACLPFLAVLAQEPRFQLHAAALGARGGEFLELAVDPTNRVTTGAHITSSESTSHRVSVPVLSLDDLFGLEMQRDDRTLLKLDLQGWELEALNGAVKTLERVEVVLVEVSFFAQAYEPSIALMVRFLDEAGFDLYDIGSLAARRRDNRARQADFVFVKKSSPLLSNIEWS